MDYITMSNYSKVYRAANQFFLRAETHVKHGSIFEASTSYMHDQFCIMLANQFNISLEQAARAIQQAYHENFYKAGMSHWQGWIRCIASKFANVPNATTVDAIKLMHDAIDAVLEVEEGIETEDCSDKEQATRYAYDKIKDIVEAWSTSEIWDVVETASKDLSIKLDPSLSYLEDANRILKETTRNDAIDTMHCILISAHACWMTLENN